MGRGRFGKRIKAERDDAARLLLEYEEQIDRFLSGRHYDFVRLPSSPGFLAKLKGRTEGGR